MKNFFFASIVLATVAAASSAIAADFPIYKTPAAAPALLQRWAGFYGGANVGYGWAKSRNDWNFFAQNAVTASLNCAGPGGGTNAFCAAGSDSASMDGIIGGIQAGYNFQSGSFLLGVESDLQASDQRRDQTFTTSFSTGIANPLGTLSANYTEKLRWFGTTRGRLGYAVDRWLVYATGGLAYGEVSNDGTATATGAGGSCAGGICPLASWRSSTTRLGWTVGAGAEAAINDQWSVKLEYLHVDLGGTTTNFATLAGGYGNTGGAGATIGAAVGAGSISSKIRDEIVRVGVNYKFDGICATCR